MRVQLKHILPLAVLLTGVVAKSSTEDSKGTATEAASATGDSATATATGDEKSTATDTGSDSSTKDSSDKDKSSKTGKDDKTTAQTTGTPTTAEQATDTWVSVVPTTTAPDLESSASSSLKKPNYIIVSLSVGLLTAGMTFL